MSINRLNIKKITAGLILAVCIFQAKTLLADPTLNAKIDNILNISSLSAPETAVAAAFVDSGKMITSLNADTPLNPASCTKIVTTAAVLNGLGPGYQFETKFYSDTPIGKDGSIHNLYIKGNGDPSFVTEELYRTVYDLTSRGIKSVTGDIIIDDTYFDGPWYPRKNGNDGRAYTALTSAVALNFNSVKLIVAPGTKVGRPAQVTTEPATPYINIVNKVRTGGRFRIYIKRGPQTPDSETFIVSGSVPPRAAPQDFYRSLHDPLKYAGNCIKYVLEEYKVPVLGKIRNGTPPENGHLIFTAKSKPLSEIVRDMNKFSNNFIAEQITKHLGAVKKGEPGSTTKGVQEFHKYLNSINFSSQSFFLENGSGLSTNNQVTARQLVKILVHLYNHRKLRSPFIESLSIMGVDGTMKSWRFEPHLKGMLRAKTGSLANVSALAGYVPTRNGKLAAFAILSNGFKKGRYSAQEAELKIVSAIAEAY